MSCSWWRERRSNTTRKDERAATVPLQVVRGREQADERHAGKETADVRPERRAALDLGQRPDRAEQQLIEEPVAEHHVGGERHGWHEKTQPDERVDTHAREQQHRRPHYA